MIARAQRLLAVVVLSALSGYVCAPVAEGAPAQTLEPDIKAAFLYNFTKFIEWPSSAFQGPSDPFQICALTDQSFVRTLENTIKGETTRGRPLELMTPNGQHVTGCHLLFIGRSEADHVPSILTSVAGRPVLTVSENPDFLDQGGAVNFVVENSRVRFDIDLAAAQRSRLVISSKLLRVARSVRESSR